MPKIVYYLKGKTKYDNFNDDEVYSAEYVEEIKGKGIRVMRDQDFAKGGNVDKKITSLDDIETPNFQEKSPDDFGQSEGVKEVTPNTISEEENKTANRNLDKDAKTLVSLKEAETKGTNGTSPEGTEGLLEAITKRGMFTGDAMSLATFDLVLTPKERAAYEKAMNKMKGGTNDNMITYETTRASKNQICDRIKGEKNIYLNQLHMVDNC